MEIITTSMALVQTNPLNNRIHGPSRTPSSWPVGGIHGSLGTRWFPELKGQCVRTGNLTCLFSPLFGCGFGALVGVRPLPLFVFVVWVWASRDVFPAGGDVYSPSAAH